MALLYTWPLTGAAAETVSRRPYEMDWAGRTNDHCAPLIDFENLNGWRVEAKDAVATFESSREQQLWDAHVGKLTYRGTGGAPEIRLVPPQPISITEPFDAVTLWCYGNNWGYSPDPNTPAVTIAALFADAVGKEFNVLLYRVDWTEWSLLHKRLTPDQIARAGGGAAFKGLLITGGRNKQDRVLYFDNLVVFTEQLPPLKFEPRPERGIAMFPGQSPGANMGPGKLPFPTRADTILPDNLTPGAQLSVGEGAEPGSFRLAYEGRDGQLVYRIRPKLGRWDDIAVEWKSPAPAGNATREEDVIRLQPCVGGGVYLATAAGAALPEQADHLGTKLNGPQIESRWRLSAAGVSAEVTYIYHLWNKSLVIDVLAPGGKVAEVRYGRAVGLENPRLVTNPFYPTDGARPAVVVSGQEASPLFLTGNTDWYLSNASKPWAANVISTNGVIYNGGTRYTPLTNGKRNDCFERFFITVSPRYEEVLPNIPNPVSPWKHITGTRVWRAHGASNREHDKQYWGNVHRHGITQVIVTDHETLWRDGGESFTFRTKAAPGKGGDQGAYDYARFMQDKLGFVYGPYNNFTDFAPVNEFWNFDMVSRTPDNQLEHAWMRCYAPKPARAVEYCARLAPQIQEKFKFSTAYCDVHTAVAPWHRVDYDPRVPGAGTFAAVFYAYGEIMLHQKKAWNGPVYSEGNYHCFYMGLTDGNYGQDQSYRPAENPWLVDFDLRKMHDLGCNFGMGNLEMFYANAKQPRSTREERDAEIDRFLAATVAFGHSGFLVMEGGMGNALRSYYMLQQLHSRYCLTNAVDIRYADGTGRLLDTTIAVASGAYQRSQVVTRYADGTFTAANGSKTERLVAEAFGRKLDLPPNGYAGWTTDGAIEVLASDPRGHRSDYAVTPAYTYVDGRGRFVRFAKAAGNGIGICRNLTNGLHEILLHEGAECGFAVNADHAVALDKDRKELGPAQIRVARGLTYVLPVKDAFSYLLSSPLSSARSGSGGTGLQPVFSADGSGDGLQTRPTNGRFVESASGDSAGLSCERDEVFPGERVSVRGQQQHEITIPANATPGQRLWFEREGRWIDFTVVALTDTDILLEATALQVRLRSNAPGVEEFTVSAAGKTRAVTLTPHNSATVTIDLGEPTDEDARVIEVEIRAAGLTQRFERGLRIVREIAPLVALPSKWSKGMALRGKPETSDFGTTGSFVEPRETSSGQVTKKGLFMHPPWQGGTGYCFARYDAIPLPATPPAAFRAFVGKGDGSDPGDGILYQLVVLDDADVATVAAAKTVTRHGWLPIEADLSRWAGRRIALKLIADVGPKDDSGGDWACWADMRLDTLRPELHYLLNENVELIRREPGQLRIPNLTLEMLRGAKSGWLHYDGRGLEGSGPYATYAVLNGVSLGEMKGAHAEEKKGAFQQNVGVPLTAEAIRSLGRHNRFVLQNPNKDYFTVRRFWLELELADGRRCSSDIAPTAFTQPPDWPPGEGMGVPFGQDITVDLWFPLTSTQTNRKD